MTSIDSISYLYNIRCWFSEIVLDILKKNKVFANNDKCGEILNEMFLTGHLVLVVNTKLYIFTLKINK